MKPTIILAVNLLTPYKIVEEIIMDYIEMSPKCDIKGITLQKCKNDGVVNVVRCNPNSLPEYELEFDTEENKTLFILKYL